MNYSKARPYILSGDVLCFCGNKPVQKGIQLWQKIKGYKYWFLNHAALVVRTSIGPLRDRIFIVEAVGSGGLVPRQLSRVWRSHGRVYWCPSAGMTAEQREKALALAIDYSTRGIKYDYAGCLSNLFGAVITDVDKYYCSEFTWWVHLQVEYAVSLNNCNPTPAQQPEWEHIMPIELNMAA
jgi:hypothetical protein